MKNVYLHLENVCVTFHGQCDSNDGLKGWFINKFSKQNRTASSYRVAALQGINLQIRQGERLGLIGLNGAGKSTLLKVMAGIYPPTEGSFKKNGRICPMFEFATGFEMTQSGWDNIRIRGLLLGMKQDEIEAKMHEIAEFSELGEFLDYPVRTYSSGMFIRLAFAVSTSINPEILLIDEVMGAGDIRFAEKAKRRMIDFMEQGKILVFASHSFDLLKNFCERTIWLEKGRIVENGPTAEVVDRYIFQVSNSKTLINS